VVNILKSDKHAGIVVRWFNMSNIDLLIQPDIKFYNHTAIKLVFNAAIDNLNFKVIKSKFTTDVFFRTEMSYENNILVNIKKEFCDWVDVHDDTFKFEIMNSKIPIVKSHILLVSDEIVITNVRELTYEQAKKEILGYIDKIGKHKYVYISEIAKELTIDIDLIVEILEDIDDNFYNRY